MQRAELEERVREQILARQIERGVVPAGTSLAPKPKAIPDWSTLSADEKRLFTHQAEVFAAFVEMTDHEIGRVIQARAVRTNTTATRFSFVSTAPDRQPARSTAITAQRHS